MSTWPFWFEWVSSVPFLTGVAIGSFGIAWLRWSERSDGGDHPDA